jgi:hypothetical protein
MIHVACGSSVGGFSNDSCATAAVQDKVCVNAQRTVAGANGTSEQLYIANTPIAATGYFKVVGSTDATATYTLIFLLNGLAQPVPTIDPLGVNETLAFTMGDFDEVRVTSNAATSTLTYELSLTPRYAV